MESLYFAIIGSKDNPLYELDMNSTPKLSSNEGGGETDNKHLNQFIVHAALDVLEDVQWQTNSTYLKVIDRFNDFYISAYVLPSSTSLISYGRHTISVAS